MPLPHERLAEALRGDVVLVVIAVSTAGVPWAAEQLAAALAGCSPPILMVTKGLAAAGGEIQVLPTLVEGALRAGRRAHSGVGGIGGPCLALELAARRETAAVIAHPDPAVLPELIDLVSAPYYHVRPSADVVGVEACAALKNLVVMAVGAVMGQLEIVGDAANGARMHNAAAAVFSQALGELEHLVHALGGRVETVLGLAGAGDLFVTCQGGRNGRMGRLLGRGLRYREAKATHMPDDTVEGAELALAVGPTLAEWCDQWAARSRYRAAVARVDRRDLSRPPVRDPLAAAALAAMTPGHQVPLVVEKAGFRDVMGAFGGSKSALAFVVEI